MPTILELCVKYYGTKNVYDLMGITKNSTEKDVKKAYYKLSLQVHPDRVPESEKIVATEKFKILSKLQSILTDKDKKALYDEKGIIDDDDDESTSWTDLWKQFFKPITVEDIDKYQKEYTGSELEQKDIKKAYLNGKGCLNYMLNTVPFMNVEDEPRIQTIVKEWIGAGDVPEYKIFTEEPKAKRARRHNKYSKEMLEAREIKKKMETKNASGSLEQQIMKRQQERAESSGNFFDRLLEKYADVDDSDDFVFDASAGLRKKQTKKKVASVVKKARANESKTAEHKVKKGKVTKTRSTS